MASTDIKRYIRSISFLAVLLAAIPLEAQDVEVVTFTPPAPLQFRSPAYPHLQLNRGEEGDAEIHFMVNTDGKPFEITSGNFVGSEEFSKAAMEAVANSTFTPPLVNGEPTAGAYRVIIRFRLEGESSASIGFIDTYRDFLESRESESRERLEQLLDTLEKRALNQYERTYLYVAQYFFEKLYGTTLNQMKYLDSALSFSREVSDLVYLPEDEVRNARRDLFKLQLANRYFRDAMDIFELIEATEDSEGANALRPYYEQILALEADDTAFGIPITLSDAGLSNIRLLKNNVYIEELDGKVAEFKARCERRYVGFAVEPEISYNLPDSWGVCSLEIVGDAGTTLTLVQH